MSNPTICEHGCRRAFCEACFPTAPTHERPESPSPEKKHRISPQAMELWAFGWGRTINLHTDREPPYVTLDQAPRDSPAEWHFQRALDAAREQGRREGLEEAVRAASGMTYAWELSEWVARALAPEEPKG